MNIEASISATKRHFEESFASGDFYNRQTQDAEHLENILLFIKIKDNMKIPIYGTDLKRSTFYDRKNDMDQRAEMLLHQR